MNIRKACPKKKRKHRKEKQLLSGLSLLLIVCILSNVGIAALYPQIVYASFAGTVAGYILTLFASFNTAITNPNVVSAINNTFGSIALEAADAGVIDQGIAQIAANTGFDMASIFSNTAAEAAQFAQAAGVEIESVASTAGENIAAGAAACAAASGAVLPAIAGTVLPASAAVGLGVAGGFLIDHIRNAIGNYVKKGVSLNTPQSIIYITGNYINIGYAFYTGTNQYIITACPDGAIPLTWTYTNKQGRVIRVFGWGNYTNNTLTYGFKGTTGNLNNYQTTYNPGVNDNTGEQNSQITSLVGYNNFNSKEEATQYINDIYNGVKQAPLKYSPDIVGNKGNQTGVYDNGNFTLPNINPIYNYGNTTIQYINPTDYETFINDANNNTEIGDTGEDTQGQDFDDFVDPYITPIEVDQPTDPDQPIPQPTIAPVQPDIPVQPTPAPEPTLTPEEKEEMPRGMVQPSLKNKFPFCIPFDIGYLLNKMSAEREAPRFVWQLDFGQWGQYTITVDLSPFDSVAAILRTLELILFILGLMLATKSLMSTSDGG